MGNNGVIVRNRYLTRNHSLSQETIDKKRSAKARSTAIKAGYALRVCKKCGRESKDKEFPIHHIDRNRDNNAEDNITVLCESCHAKEHVNERPRVQGKWT